MSAKQSPGGSERKSKRAQMLRNERRLCPALDRPQQSAVDAGLPAWAGGLEVVDHFGGQAQRDQLLGWAFLRAALTFPNDFAVAQADLIRNGKVVRKGLPGQTMRGWLWRHLDRRGRPQARRGCGLLL